MRAPIVLALLALLATRAAADGPVGFAHVRHDGKVTVTGAPSIPCADCHRIDKKGRLRGRPGHAACFGACHGAAPRAQDAPTGELCIACHAPGAAKVAYPPYTLDPDFGLAISHASHDAAGCATCHDAEGRPAGGKGHDRCARCHLAPKGDAPSFDACTTCHAPAWGPARSPELLGGTFALTGFSHRGHARASKASCKACHGAIAADADADLPAPRTEDCATAGCHDGRAAFATTVACTQCHLREPTGTYELARPTERYSHDRHRPRLAADVTCAACHRLDGRGEAVAPDHGACAGCHAADFVSTAPVTCGACHVAIEPWRELRADALPRPETEFGAEMPHRRHADRGLGCAGCHSLADARRDRRPPRGHASCTGAGCHAAGAATPAPALDDCAGCHRAGAVAARIQERLDARWSVRARFPHDAHDATCETCHAEVWTVDGPPPAPAKSTCAPCHDGGAAFKMTGHGCARCHGS